MKKKYYITTPIYFPNDKLHIGHSYTTVVADTLARYKKMRGYDVLFLTGTDEHGQKIERTAKAMGVSPKEYVDKIVVWIKELWHTMDIDYDIYIRTTDEIHEKAVQKIFKKLYDQGDIYKSSYEGLYCTPCETFFTTRQAPDCKCPDCGRPVENVKEESYFFKLSKYQDRITKHIEEHDDFILPVSRKNEMVNNFLKPGLEDLCVSRTSFTWGIPVDFDKGHIVYVWIDALSNYISALGYTSDDDSLFQKFWPADLHLMSKEIVRFHTIIWPAILMALDLPLPKQIFAHGWLVFDGKKMGKSTGNVVDPNVLVERYGIDSIRYFLMREIVFGQDGNFTNEALIQRINSDLANDLGNLVSRTVGMIEKYFDGALQLEQVSTPLDDEIILFIKNSVEKTEKHMDNLETNDALNEIWNIVRRINKYTDESAPWILVKDETKKAELSRVLYVLAESLRIISVLISPFMPNTPLEIRAQLNITDDNMATWESTKTFGLLEKDVKISKGNIIFPRLDIKKEMEELEKITLKTQKNNVANKLNEEVKEEFIGIDDFNKVNFKVGKVIACEKVDGSDKLLKSQIKIGSEVRQIVSGIAMHYTPDQMLGKKVIVVTNLKPVKLRGVLSEGMILAASDENGNLNALTVDGDIEDGAVVK